MVESEKKLPVWIFSFALFPLGLGGFALGAADILAGYQSRHWIKVEGVVLSSRLAPSVLAPRQPEIRYSYRVEGTPFVSSRLWPGHTLAHMPVLRSISSRKWVEQFNSGKIIGVYVNPADPTTVALIPGPRKAYLWMGIFTFFLSVGFWSPLALGKLYERRQMKASD